MIKLDKINLNLRRRLIRNETSILDKQRTMENLSFKGSESGLGTMKTGKEEFV